MGWSFFITNHIFISLLSSSDLIVLNNYLPNLTKETNIAALMEAGIDILNEDLFADCIITVFIRILYSPVSLHHTHFFMDKLSW